MNGGSFESSKLRIRMTAARQCSPSLGSRTACVCFLIYVFIGRAGSSLLRLSFLQLWCADFFLPQPLSLLSAGSGVCGFQFLWRVGSGAAAQGLQSMGSLVVAPRVSYSEAGGIFPDQGSNLCPLHCKAES